MRTYIRRGSTLLLSLYFVLVVGAMVGALATRTAVEVKASTTFVESSKAFHKAEAGIDTTIQQLQADWYNCGSVNTVYANVTVDCTDASVRTLTSVAYESNSVQTIYVTVRPVTNPVFGSAIYTSESVEVSGTSNLIEGNVTVYDESLVHPDANVSGEIVEDSDVRPLKEFDWDYLRSVAESQGNVYNSITQPFMPSTFYRPDGSVNVVIYDGENFVLSGSRSIGGLIIINPGDVGTFIQNGNGNVDGCIYVKGDVEFNGQGYRRVNGCVLSAGDVVLNGSVEVRYNDQYANELSVILNEHSTEILIWRQDF